MNLPNSTVLVQGGELPEVTLHVDDRGLLVAACWCMWGSIAQARATDLSNETLLSLYSIAREAMIRAGQLPDPCAPEK